MGIFLVEMGTWYPHGPDKGEILGQSGVSIATGVDLGQQNEASFKGLSETLIAKLRPYLGLKKEDARKALLENPLSLSLEEVKQIDALIKKRYIDNTANRFGKETFESSPKQVQAVAVSLCYQFGSPKHASSPALENAWNAMRRVTMVKQQNICVT